MCALAILSYSGWFSPASSVCKRKKAAIPAVSYDNSANNSSWCSTAAAHNESAKRQEQLALSLLVFGILGADDHYFAVPFDDLAFVAHGFDGSTYFHNISP